jgi:hypothetical protein
VVVSAASYNTGWGKYLGGLELLNLIDLWWVDAKAEAVNGYLEKQYAELRMPEGYQPAPSINTDDGSVRTITTERLVICLADIDSDLVILQAADIGELEVDNWTRYPPLTGPQMTFFPVPSGHSFPPIACSRAPSAPHTMSSARQESMDSRAQTVSIFQAEYMHAEGVIISTDTRFFL